MARISIQDLELASRRFKRLSLSKLYPNMAQPRPLKVRTDNVPMMSQAIHYAYATKDNTPVPLVRIATRLENLCIDTAGDIKDPQVFASAIGRAWHIRDKLSVWYKNIYLKDTRDFYPDLELDTEITGSSYMYGVIPFIAVDTHNMRLDIFEVSQEVITGDAMWDDIITRLRILLLYKHLGKLPTSVERLIVSNTGVKSQKMKINSLQYAQSFITDTLKMAQHLARGIEKDVSYPSFNEQCNTCLFRHNNICKF